MFLLLQNLFYLQTTQTQFFLHKDPSCLLNTVNQEMPKFSQWLMVNKLPISLNIDKTKFILFKPRQKKDSPSISNRYCLKTSKTEIKHANETVFLGVIIDEHLTWKSHVAHVLNKISKSIGIIRRCSFFLTTLITRATCG